MGFPVSITGSSVSGLPKLAWSESRDLIEILGHYPMFGRVNLSWRFKFSVQIHFISFIVHETDI